MVLVGVGTFFAQACATGFVGQAASDNRGIASGTYLACYFLGGLVGSAVLGQLVRPLRLDRLRRRRRRLAGACGAVDRAAYPQAVRRVSGMNSQIIARPRAAMPASPMKAVLLPNCVADIAGEHGAERRADAGRGADDALRQIEMAAAEGDIGDDQRHHHAEHGGGDAVEHLHRDQTIGIAHGRKQQAADRQRAERQQQQRPPAPSPAPCARPTARSARRWPAAR